MPIKKVTTFVGTIIVLGLLVVGFSYLEPTAPTNDAALGYVLESVKAETYTGVLPPLDREVQFAKTLSAEAVAQLRTQIEKDIDRLEDTPWDGTTWMGLAVRYHTAEDYAAALTVWEFLLEVTPENITVLNNAGRLYHFTLRDYPKAEEYFNRAVEVNSARPEAYYELFDLYRYSYKRDTTAAVDIMRKAGEAFPDDVNVPLMLGTYYRDAGRLSLARAQFEKALTMARNASDVQLVQTITTELARLP